MRKKVLIWCIGCCGTAEKLKNRRQEVLAEGYGVIDFEGGFYRMREDDNAIFLNLYVFSIADKSYQKALDIIDEFALECGDLDSRPASRRQKENETPYPAHLYSEDELREIRDMGGVGERRWF